MFSYCRLREDDHRKTKQEEAECNENGSCDCAHHSHGITSFSGITGKWTDTSVRTPIYRTPVGSLSVLSAASYPSLRQAQGQALAQNARTGHPIMLAMSARSKAQGHRPPNRVRSPEWNSRCCSATILYSS